MRKLLTIGATALFALVVPAMAQAAAPHAPQVQPKAAAASWRSPQSIDGHTVMGVLSLTATAYGPSLQDNYPYGATDYFGRPLIPGDVAVDPNVIPLGTRLWITGYSSPMLPQGGFMARAVDEGDAIQGNRVDVFIDGSEATVSNFGVQHVTAYILGN